MLEVGQMMNKKTPFKGSKKKKKKVQRRASKMSRMEMLADKYSQKAEIKRDELEI